MREYILSGNLLLRSSPIFSSILGGRVGRGAMICIPTEPTVVEVGPIYPYAIAAVAGLMSSNRLMNPIRCIEAIVISMLIRNSCLAALNKEKEKEENGPEKSARW